MMGVVGKRRVTTAAYVIFSFFGTSWGVPSTMIVIVFTFSPISDACRFSFNFPLTRSELSH